LLLRGVIGFVVRHHDTAADANWLPQNGSSDRSWYVNVSSSTSRMVIPHELDANSHQQLDILFDAHYERITRVIGRVIHDQSRAEEIAVEVFLKWCRNPKAHGEHAEGWLYRTATREALDELRRQVRRSRFERILSPFISRSRTPEQLLNADVEQQNVRTVLAALDQRLASLLLLWSQDLSYREMAIALDIAPNYVGSLLSRAQEAFRKEYVKRYGNQSF
jgi:RNA polymerase sigma-70 factor (ECF subfamily)